MLLCMSAFCCQKNMQRSIETLHYIILCFLIVSEGKVIIQLIKNSIYVKSNQKGRLATKFYKNGIIFLGILFPVYFYSSQFLFYFGLLFFP